MLETCSICVIFLIGIIAIVWLMYPRKSEPFRLTLGSQITDTPVKEEEYQPPPGVKTDFIINNYLPSRALSVTVLDPSGKETELAHSVPPKGRGGLTSQQVIKYLVGGNTLVFYIAYPKGHKFQNKTEEKEWVAKSGNKRRIEYSRYYIDTAQTERIKALHVGMVTSRIRRSPNQYSSAAANSVQGQGHITIHNYSNIPLSLNKGKIIVPPNGWTQYAGHMRTGVPLGTWFNDDSGMYAVWQYLQPQTDLYYGVVSDSPQALNGGWVYTERGYPDVEDYGQTMYPLEEGIY